MRTIKFRGKVEYPQKYFGDKDIPNGRWIVGDLHLSWCYPHIHIDTKDKYPINPNTVGQFTGLYDWCGNEIYEGDILESLDFDKENKFVVEWNQVLAQFQGRWLHQPAIACDIYSMCHGGNYGVCGNIHDNPELLKGK